MYPIDKVLLSKRNKKKEEKDKKKGERWNVSGYEELDTVNAYLLVINSCVSSEPESSTSTYPRKCEHPEQGLGRS